MEKFSDYFSVDSQSVDQTLEVSVPGKLFLAGEYAILAPNQAAIIMAINQYIHFTIQPTNEKISTVTSKSLSQRPLRLKENHYHLEFDTSEPADWSFVQEAIRCVYQLLKEMGLKAQAFYLTINSEMEDISGIKLGLGSSAAVTVGTILALLQLNGLHPKDSQVLFKLATIASIKQGSNGSMGDIAAVASGEWVYYQTFNHQWLKDQLNNQVPLLQLIKQPWPELVIESLPQIKDLNLAVAWTGQPASTQGLVAQLQERLPQKPQDFDQFIAKVYPLIQELKQAIMTNDREKFLQAIQENQEALSLLGESYQLPMMTEKLVKFVQIAEENGATAKVSGAGGGDCGICFYHPTVSLETLTQAWEHAGITYLPLTTAAQTKL